MLSYFGIDYCKSGASYLGSASVFMLINLVPLIIIQFENHGAGAAHKHNKRPLRMTTSHVSFLHIHTLVSGLDIDFARFLKSDEPYDPKSFVAQLIGGWDSSLTGLYKQKSE